MEIVYQWSSMVSRDGLTSNPLSMTLMLFIGGLDIESFSSSINAYPSTQYLAFRER